MLVRRFSLLALILPFALAAEPVDLNVPAAQAKYDAQKAISDKAWSRMSEKERIYRDAESDYYAAVARERDARQALSTAEAKLVDIGNLIVRLEREITNLRSQISDLERDKDRKEDEINNLERKGDQLRREIGHQEHELRDVDSDLSAEKAKPTPDQAKIQQLESKHNQIESEIRNLESQLDRVQRDIQDCQSAIRRIESDIRDCENSLHDTERRLQQANRDRQDQIRVISNCESEVRQAEQEVRFCQFRMDDAHSEYLFAKSDYDREAVITQRAYDYLQLVIANYEREKQKVVQLATKAGTSHGVDEAEDRAPAPGAVDGKARALSVGQAVGSTEASDRDFARGYREGREKGATLASVAADYRAGVLEGEALAVQKAAKESLPKGYNDALAALLSTSPAKDALVDLSESTPADPGGSGQELSTSPKPVGSQPAPAFVILQDPPYVLPGAGAVSPSIPARDNRYFSPPCAGLILAEFEPLCRRVYDESYGSGYLSGYRDVYGQAFGAAYTANIKAAYDAALTQTFQESLQAGLKRGAAELGVLNGFDAKLPVAVQEQYATGKQLLSSAAQGGHLIRSRGLDLAEANRDGLFTPGEVVKLKAVVENYGGQASPNRKYRVRVTRSEGLTGLSVELRELPALAGETRTTLEGIVTAKVANLFAGQKVKIEGVLEGGALAVPFSLEKVAHFPLELEAVTLAKKPKIDEKVAATFRYRNLTNERTPEAKLELSTNPQIVKIDTTGLVIPALDPGQSVDVATKVAPGYWVGENTSVEFVSKAENVGGIEKLTQRSPQYLSLDRDGVLLLYNDAGKDISDSTIVVTAGSRVNFQVLFKYLRNYNLPGPFLLQAGQKSHTSISHSSGSTVSVNYGSFGPGFQPGKVRFSYDIPQALKGQQGWVMIVMYNGNTVLHALQVWLDIR